MREVVVRIAGETDLPAVAALRRMWTEELRGSPVPDPDFEQLLAERDGLAVGMANLAVFTRMPRPATPPSSWAHLANVYVVPSQRDGGIGGQVVERAVVLAAELGCVRVVLSPSERSVRLYERAGFGPATMLMARTLGRAG